MPTGPDKLKAKPRSASRKLRRKIASAAECCCTAGFYRTPRSPSDATGSALLAVEAVAVRGRRDRHGHPVHPVHPDPCPGPTDPATSLGRRDPYPARTVRRGRPATRRAGGLRGRRDRTCRGGDGPRGGRIRRRPRRRRRSPRPRKRCRPRSPPTPRPGRGGNAWSGTGAPAHAAAEAGRAAAGSGVRVLGSCLDHAHARAAHQPTATVSRPPSSNSPSRRAAR